MRQIKRQTMQSILIDFPNKTSNDYLYILPIERFSINQKSRVKNLVIYPKGAVDINELFKNHSFLEDNSREINKLKENALIAFLSSSPVKFPAQVTNNLNLLNFALEYTIPILDFYIFNYCNINNNSTLPGRVGQIETGESILLMFNDFGSPFTRIICEKVNTNTISLGNGLTISEPDLLNSFPLLNNDISEIGNVARHALRMYTQILESNSNTEKFIQIIRLFEFIASPDKYEKFQNVKAKIISHIAKNIHQIHEISEEFKYYSSGSNGDGLRTQIFHKGKRIEELVDENKSKGLFEKLHKYIFICLTDLLINYNKDWVFIEQFRAKKHEIAEKNKTLILTDDYASTIVLIDGDFLSRSIIRFQEMYLEVYPQKEMSKISLARLCYETLLNTRKWEEGKIFGFLIFYSGVSKFPFVDETFSEMDGKKIKIDKAEFEFHAFQFETNEKLLTAVNNLLKDLNENRKVITDKLSIFDNIVFCGDNKNYENAITEIQETGTKDIVLIRNTHDSEMELGTQYFAIGNLVGKSLGLKSNEL